MFKHDNTLPSACSERKDLDDCVHFKDVIPYSMRCMQSTHETAGDSVVHTDFWETYAGYMLHRSSTLPIPCPVCQARGEPLCTRCGPQPNEIHNGGGKDCCCMDPDVALLLTPEEQAEYLQCSIRVGINSSPDLIPCPQPDCTGAAVVGTGTIKTRPFP